MATSARQISHDGPVFDNVIVPTNGSIEGRVVFAPARDFAWRCRARLVNVSNIPINDDSSKSVVKQRAITQSGSETEYWVDNERPLAEAAVVAASFRPNSVICIASPAPRSKVLRLGRRPLNSVATEVIRQSDVPVVVIGPSTETDQGMPMTEVIALLDGTATSEAVLVSASQWASNFKVDLLLAAVLPSSTGSATSESQRQSLQVEYLRAQAASMDGDESIAIEVIPGRGTARDFTLLLNDHESAVVMIARGPVGSRVSKATTELLKRSPRAVVLMPS